MIQDTVAYKKFLVLITAYEREMAILDLKRERSESREFLKRTAYPSIVSEEKKQEKDNLINIPVSTCDQPGYFNEMSEPLTKENSIFFGGYFWPLDSLTSKLVNEGKD